MVAKIALVECMAAVDNPRVDRNTAHELVDILVWSVLAVLCGADGWEDIELFDKIRLSGFLSSSSSTTMSLLKIRSAVFFASLAPN